jgi:hypothetical protein
VRLDVIFLALTSDPKASVGKISFTADIWSSKGMHSYLAITAHWLGPRGDDGQVVLRQALLAFHHIRGAHNGQQIARIVFNILENAGIIRNVIIYLDVIL